MKTGNNRRKSARWTLAALALALAGAAQAGRIPFDDGWEFALKGFRGGQSPPKIMKNRDTEMESQQYE